MGSVKDWSASHQHELKLQRQSEPKLNHQSLGKREREQQKESELDRLQSAGLEP